jgi:redox-sensitive bicupin YhaK (pirin superfamily)
VHATAKAIAVDDGRSRHRALRNVAAQAEEPVTNHSKLYQIWLNLPRKSKMVNPCFIMHWAEDIRRWADQDNGAKVVVWAGEFAGLKGLAPPPDSWAADEANDVNIWYITLQPHGGKVRLPAARTGAAVSRRLYLTEGSKTGVAVAGVAAHLRYAYDLDGTATVTLANNGDKVAEFLLLQGRPLGEPVVQHGPFVMNTRAEIQQAFMDYQETRFGGWPWQDDANVFPREKGRFTLVNGVETFPPNKTAAAATTTTTDSAATTN